MQTYTSPFQCFRDSEYSGWFAISFLWGPRENVELAQGYSGCLPSQWRIELPDSYYRATWLIKLSYLVSIYC